MGRRKRDSLLLTNRNLVWSINDPSTTRCCECKCRLTPEQVMENRPTGRDGAVQSWYYCDTCYVSYNRVCNQPWDERAFLEFLGRLDDRYHCPFKAPQIKIR